MSITDEELIARHLNKDPNAFQQLINRSIGPVHNFVRIYIRNNEEAEDVVQDSFLKAWKNLKRFDTNKKWKTWLLTIARNTALDHLKKKKADPFSAMDTADQTSFADTIVDEAPLAAELFEQTERMDLVAKATEHLRSEYNSVLMLHYHQELTFEEISTVMGIPMNTVKSWHRRALLQLKSILETSAPNINN